MILNNSFGQATEYVVKNSEGTIAAGDLNDNRYVEIQIPEFSGSISVTFGGHNEGIMDNYDDMIITRSNLTDVFLISRPSSVA